MSTLILHLPLSLPGPATEYRYTLSNDGHSASSSASAALALLPSPRRATGETVALVPAQALSWQRASLPQGVGVTSPRLRAVLEGLLEERLLDDPAQLHFALGPDSRTSANTNTGSALWVAVCDRAWLRAHLQALENAGFPAARVVPEFAPANTDTQETAAAVQVLGTPEDARLLLPGCGPTHQGVLLLPLSASAVALMHHTPLADGQTPPPIYAEPAVAALAEQLLNQPVVLQTASARALLALNNGWNLAQFDLASTGGTRLRRKAATALGAWIHAPQWLAARWGVGLLAVVHLVGLNAWAWQERQTLAAKQSQTSALLTQTFPRVQVVVDAPVQMERELALLRQATGSLSARDLEPLLASVANALPPSWQARNIDYTPGQLRLQGPTLSAAEQTHATQQLRASGYTLDTDSDALTVRTANTSSP